MRRTTGALDVTVVMVHGAGGGGWEWRLWAGVFAAAGRDVLAPDLRPMPAGIAATRFEHYRAQVLALSRERRCVLIGASLGGLLALSVSAQANAAALVLVNPMPPAGVEPRPPLRDRPAVVPWSTSAFGATRAALADADLATARWVHARWRDESGAVLAQAQAGVTVDPPRCPVLVMAGADDRDIPPANSRALARALGGDFISIPDAGHLGMLLGRRATAAAALAQAWLGGLGQPGNND